MRSLEGSLDANRFLAIFTAPAAGSPA